MFDRLVGLKNLLWAIGIVLCLILLFIGIIFSAASPYHGEADPRTPDLNAVRDADRSADVESLSFVEPDGALHKLQESKDAGEDYIRSAVFLTDSIMVSLRDQSLTGGDVWSSTSGSLNMANIATWNILYSDGSKISPAEACMIMHPKLLIIAVGSDGLAKVKKDDFISGYVNLIRSIQRASSDTKIVCCSVAPVADGYPGFDDLTSELAFEATEWVKEVCTQAGVYYADTNEVVRSGQDLNPKYAAANFKQLNTVGLQAVLGYLRTHAVP